MITSLKQEDSDDDFQGFTVRNITKGGNLLESLSRQGSVFGSAVSSSPFYESVLIDYSSSDVASRIINTKSVIRRQKTFNNDELLVLCKRC